MCVCLCIAVCKVALGRLWGATLRGWGRLWEATLYVCVCMYVCMAVKLAWGGLWGATLCVYVRGWGASGKQLYVAMYALAMH